MRQLDIFYSLMKELQEKGVLQDVILIGSWCQYFYKEYFGHTPYIPEVRTVDIDFLIPNPPRIRNKIDVTALLIELGFMEKIDQLSGLSKFIHDDLIVEFLFPEQGKGKNTPYDIKALNINAVGLRYLNLIQSYLLKIEREDITVIVPEPAAFVLHKHIVSQRRVTADKKMKDAETAIDIGNYLLTNEIQKDKLKLILSEMPIKWQKNVLDILKDQHLEMYQFLSEPQ